MKPNNNQEKEKDSQKKLLLLLLLLLLITILAVSITIWALFFREKPVLAPDYAPQETEAYAETIPNDDKTKLDKPEGGGSVSLTYSRDVSIDLSDEKASLMFANPGKSNQDMVLQLVIQEEVICQSGTLTPGHHVNNLELLKGAAKKLSAGTYEGHFNVLYYDQESGEKAIVNTEIPVTVTVKK